VAQLLANDPADAIGLWFLGLDELRNPATRQQALAHLTDSIGHGITRVLPVDPELLETVRRLAAQPSSEDTAPTP
jgi:hypothetical protein